MNDELVAAFEPVYRDLRASCPVLPVLEQADDQALDTGLWLKESDGSGRMITVLPRMGKAERIAHLADQVQEWAVEALWSAGLPATWPECPAHPETHPLAAGVSSRQAVWQCPRTGSTTVRVGQLRDIVDGRNP